MVRWLHLHRCHRLWKAVRTILLISGLVSVADADVDVSGGFRTGVTLKVPAYHGLEPPLQLSYHSQRGNGSLGVGWGMSGLSFITRTSVGKGAPNYDTNDVFYLDGLELTPCTAGMSSPSCKYPAAANYQAYTTRIESFQRVALDTSTLGQTWYVWNKTGTKMKYEAGSHGGSVARWLLTSVIDTHGNQVNYSYWHDGTSLSGDGDYYIDRISYNGVVIKFYYESRPDILTFALGIDEPIAVRYRLITIEVLVGASRARAYKLSYRQGVANRSFLEAVQEFGNDAVVNRQGRVIRGTALQPVKFLANTNSSSVGLWSPNISTSITWGPPWPNNGGVTGSANFNDQSNLDWNLVWGTQRWFPADMNGDGRQDFVNVFLEEHSTGPPFYTLRVAQTTANGSYRYFTQQIPAWNWSRSLQADFFRAINSDLNGDGKADVLIIAPNSANPQEVWVRPAISNGDGTFEIRPASVLPITAWNPRRRWFSGDVNADGKSDLMFVDLQGACDPLASGQCGCASNTPLEHAHLLVGISNGDGSYEFKPAQETCWSFLANDDPHWFVGDADGDGKSDFMRLLNHGPDTAQSRYTHVALQTALSKGDGTFALKNIDTGRYWLTASPPDFYLGLSKGSDVAQVGDFNADGKTDFLFINYQTLAQPRLHRLVFSIATLNVAGTYDISEFDSGNLNARLINMYWEVQLGIKKYPNRWLTGDFNGDAATDIAIVSPSDINSPSWPTTVSITKLFSDKKGGFVSAPVEPTTWFNDCYVNPDRGVGHIGGVPDECVNDLMFSVFGGDVTGDGISDVMYAGHRAAGGPVTRANLHVSVSATTGLDTFRWMIADVNGDQYEDRTHVFAMNPGVRVRTLFGHPGGSSVVKDHFGGLQNPVMRNWKTMDVGGGPGGAADGKTDLVYVAVLNDVTGTGTRVYTLLAGNNGTWAENTSDLPKITAQDSLYWKPADVNGDGKTDLVHILKNQSQTSLVTLFSNGNGTWIPATAPYNFPPTPDTLSAADVLNWMPTDANGDGKTDLVHVDHLSAGLRVHTLLSKGDGTWDVRFDDPWPGFSAPNQQYWFSTDVNADGKRDLVQLVPLGTGARVHTLLSTGNGKWARRQQDVWQGVFPIGVDLNNWRAADVNGDGHPDLVHLADWGNKVRIESLLSRGDGSWVERGPDFRSWPGGVQRDSVFWRLADIDGDTKAEFTRVDFENANLQVSTIVSDAPLESLAQVNSSLGSQTLISYRSAHAILSANPLDASNLPAGFHANVVSTITTYDGRTPTPDRETYTFKRPRWSNRDRTLLAWRSIDVDHGTVDGRPRFIVSSDYVAFEQGIVQPVQIQRKDQNNGVWSYQRFVYQSIGNSAPYLSLIASRLSYECNLTNTCLQNQSDITHDEFGNVVQEMSYGSGKPEQFRTVRRSFFPATAAYIVGLLALETTYAGDTTGPQMRSVSYVYDKQASYATPPTKGLLTTVAAVIDQTGALQTTEFDYDIFGNQTKVTDANSHSTTIGYDPTYHMFPESNCNAKNQCTGLQWDYALGVVKKFTDINSKETWFDHDPLGRLRTTTLPDGGIVTREHLDYGNPAQQRIVQRLNDGSRDGLWEISYLDGFGRTYRVSREGVDRRAPSFIIDTSFVGSSEQVLKQSHWYQQLRLTSAPIFEVFAYDGAGRVIKQTHPDNTFLRWSYANDTNDHLVTATDELGHQKETYSDAYGRISKVREKNFTNYYSTFYRHDVLNNLTSITDHAGNVSTFTWDSLGRMLTSKTPDSGLWSYQYDDADNLKLQTDARGLQTGFTYDELNRLKTKQFGPPNGETATFNYDEPGHGSGIGRLTSVSDPTGYQCGAAAITEQLSYDPVGRVTSRTKCIKGNSQTTSVTYDTLGRFQTKTYPGPETITYGYDPAGRLYSMTGYVNAISYDASGRTTSVSLANGTTERYQYDPKRHWLDAASVVKGTQTLYQANYSHTNDGLISLTSSATNKMNLGFGYDHLHRLTSVEDDYPQLIEYDAIGNISYNTRAGGSYLYAASGPNGCGNATPCARPHALKGINQNNSYSYDNNGNMIMRNGRQIWWNYENQPIAVQTPQGASVFFEYDAAGQRVYKDGPLDDNYYFSPELELSDNNGLTKYYYAGSRLVARRDASGTYWYHGDQLGSTRIITDQQGGVVQRYGYRAFGEKEKSSATFSNNIDFTGHRTDDEISLVYMNGRYYDPVLGKFVSADPIIPEANNPQALNSYAYVYNNPITSKDPTGFQPEGDPSEWKPWEEKFEKRGFIGEVIWVYGYSPPPLVEAVVTSEPGDFSEADLKDFSRRNMFESACPTCHRFSPGTNVHETTQAEKYSWIGIMAGTMAMFAVPVLIEVGSMVGAPTVQGGLIYISVRAIQLSARLPWIRAIIFGITPGMGRAMGGDPRFGGGAGGLAEGLSAMGFSRGEVTMFQVIQMARITFLSNPQLFQQLFGSIGGPTSLNPFEQQTPSKETPGPK